jgi:hypothetical protein
MRFPITVYRDDPDQNRLAEWHEVVYDFDSKGRTFILLDKHGWWDNALKEPLFKSDVLIERLKNEGDASAAMDARIIWLEEQGWIHKFTSQFDSHAGKVVPIKIP